jgi:hypothetical protein
MPELQPLPSSFTPTAKVMSRTASRIPATRNASKKPTHKKNKVLTDITDMYAIGLGVTK